MQGENYIVCKYFSKLYYCKSNVFKDIRITIDKFNMNWNYTAGFDTYSLKKKTQRTVMIAYIYCYFSSYDYSFDH